MESPATFQLEEIEFCGRSVGKAYSKRFKVPFSASIASDMNEHSTRRAVVSGSGARNSSH